MRDSDDQIRACLSRVLCNEVFYEQIWAKLIWFSGDLVNKTLTFTLSLDKLEEVHIVDFWFITKNYDIF